MKGPVISERMFLYWTDREHPNTCRMTVRMQDAIEVTMMQEALRQTQTRYPYYSVRLGVTTDANGHEHYEYDDNPAPWVLNIGQEPVELFGAADTLWSKRKHSIVPCARKIISASLTSPHTF